MKPGHVLMFFVGIGLTMARSVDRFVDDIKNEDNSTKLMENRKHKPYYHDLFLFGRKTGFSTVHVNPLHGIAFMGGLQSLVTFIVIKIKIVLVVATVIGFIVLGAKLFGLLKYSGYSYKNDYPSFVGPGPEFLSYGGQSFSPYSSSHSDHDTYSNDWPPSSDRYARSADKFAKSINMTEIIDSFMNVDKEDCRARLICELETMLSPFYHYSKRHDIRKNEESENQLENCTAYYTKCLGSTRRRLIQRNAQRHDDSQLFIHRLRNK